MNLPRPSNPLRVPSARDHGSDPWAGVWRLIDPRITLASMASVALGACLALHDGAFHGPWLLLVVLGIFCVEAAKNASGELVDWDTGVDQAVAPEDRSPFSGGKRVLVDGLLSRRETRRVARVLYAAGALVGALIVAGREPAVLWLGLGGAALAYFYHAPPVRLSYRGLGEVAVALAYGPLVCCGTYLTLAHRVTAGCLWLSLPYGLLVAAFLWLNELPDFHADRAAGKRTLVVRLGRRRAGRVFAALVGASFLGVALLPLVGLPAGVLGGLLGLPAALYAARRAWRSPESTRDLIPAQSAALLSFVLLAAGASAGLLLSGLG